MIGDLDQRTLLFDECNQLVAIFTRIGKTSKQPPSPKSEFRNPNSEISS